MSYRLILSPCLENAITHYLNEILPQGLFDESLLYIAQNQQTAEWFSSIMSQKTGTILGVNLQLIEQALCQISQGFSCVQQATEYDIQTQKMAKPFLNRKDLELLLYYKIVEYQEHPNLEFVRNYLSKIPSRQQDQHIWILAQNLGVLFYSYAQRSQKLINIWRNNNTLIGHQEPLLETWQRFLWYQCFGKESPSYNLLSDWLDRIIQGNYHYTGSLRKIILIGTVSLHKVYLDFLQKLSENISIIHFILQPLSEDHTHLDWPLLVTHKTMYNRFLNYFSLQQPAIIKEYVPLPNPLNLKQKHSSLEKLQYTLFTGQSLDHTMDPDQSIRHLSCSNEEREIEVIKDLLLHKLDEDPTLHLNDIAIVAPNIEKYTSYLEAIFERGNQAHKLAYNIIDANTNADPLFLQAISGLLKLVGGKFTTAEIFELLNNPLIIRRHNINEEELKIWNNFCKETHILIGKNKFQRQEQNLGETYLNTFDIGFLRFSLGQVFGDIQTEYGRSLTDISYDLGQKIAKFMYIIEKLYNDFYPLAQSEMSLIQWFNCLEKLFIEHLLNNTEEKNHSHTLFFPLRENFRKIQSLPNEEKHISFLVIKEILDNRIRDQIQKSGFLLNESIICASLATLRSIPFRIIAVLGLNNDTFPRNTSVHHFDLLQVSTLKEELFIDDETFHLDHHIFLETLFSVRQELWLFHQDRDGITGGKLFSSNSLRDLEIFLTNHIYNTNTLESYKVIFPHNPFAANLFSKNLPLIQSYDTKNYQLAQIVYGQTDHAENLLNEEPLNEHPPWEQYQHNVTAIHTIDFIQFIRNPNQYFLTKTLKITEWQNSLTQIDNIYDLHTLSYYQELNLYTQMVAASLCDQDFSWENFLNIQLTDFLKSGELGESIYSHLYRSHIYEISLWLMNEIQTIKTENNLLLRCHLHNQQIGPEFLPYLSHSSTTWNGYFWGELPHIFIDYSQKIVHGITLIRLEKSFQIKHLAQIYVQHLLCLPQFIDYQFQIKIFYLKNKKSDTIKLSQDWKRNEFCIRDCIIKNFLFSQKYLPRLDTNKYDNYSLYKNKNKKNSLINIKEQGKFSTQKLFPCEVELEKIFFERIMNQEN